MLLWARIVSLLVAVSVQAQERVVDLTPKSESDERTSSQSNWREQVDCRGWASTGRIGSAPILSLTVARLDRSELSIGWPLGFLEATVHVSRLFDTRE